MNENLVFKYEKEIEKEKEKDRDKKRKCRHYGEKFLYHYVEFFISS